MTVDLVEVDVSNLDETLRLSVGNDQRGFVASNAVSIAQSKFYPTLKTESVFDGKTMVGFVMYGLDPDEGRYTLIRLMVDQEHQGKGYGRSATEAVLERLKEVEDCKEVYLSYVPANEAAAALYESIGFRKTGEIEKESGEIIMKYVF